MSESSPTATATIEHRIAAIRRRIERACDRAGRDPAEVRLVAVSKTQPVAAVREALEAGLVDFGENRAQEFVPKAAEAETTGLAPTWHFIGHLQRNKVRDVMPYVGVLHSLDSPRLIEEIERRRPQALAGHSAHAGGPLPC
jgi:PLP dependent protein